MVLITELVLVVLNQLLIYFDGVVVATAFTGDGTGLTGVASTDNIITGTAATFTGGDRVSIGATQPSM